MESKRVEFVIENLTLVKAQNDDIVLSNLDGFIDPEALRNLKIAMNKKGKLTFTLYKE